MKLWWPNGNLISARTSEILEMVAVGAPDKVIAAKLGTTLLSIKAVVQYSFILVKPKYKTRTALAHWWRS